MLRLDRNFWRLIACLLLACGLLAASGRAAPPWTKPVVLAPAGRAVLTSQQLLGGAELEGPQDERGFARPAGAAPPAHVFEGRLTLRGQATRGRYEVLRGTASGAQRRLPRFDHAFVQRGSHLIPAERGLIITGDAAWQLILEPGRVWHEPTDQGYSRASLPFALVAVNQMCTHNGVLTFLFDASSVSHVWYQITQETCLFRKGNFWGMLEAQYRPASVPRAAAIRRDHAKEIARRLPTAPLTRLATDYPGLDLSQFGRGVSRQHMTSHGVVYRGVSYRAPCRTRFGASAYCRQMRTPSYSTAKSGLAAVALMRLAQKYGAEVLEQKIAFWVEEAAASPGDWSDVTFLDALDMATGHYHRSEPFDDEGRRLDAFFLARTTAEKLAAAFDAPRRAAPGTTWVYRSSDHFILTHAMQAFVRDREGPGADIFDLVVREVYGPLGIGPGFHSVLRTADGGWRGDPFGFSGLFFTPDDIAKLTVFLNVDRGRIGGRQVLHRATLDAALQRIPGRRGFQTGTPSGFYQHGFFGARIVPEGTSATRAFWAPHMSGFGGIIFALLPNGVTYHYSSDNNQFVFHGAAIEAMTRLPSVMGDGGSGGGGGAPGCELAVGHPHYCRDCGPCGDGEGDCDRDTDCSAGLFCVDNVGAAHGFAAGIDVCQASDGAVSSCPLPAGHPHYCRDCGPCARGEGDCDRDSDCRAGLSCVDNIGAEFGFNPGIDVCRER